MPDNNENTGGWGRVRPATSSPGRAKGLAIRAVNPYLKAWLGCPDIGAPVE